MKKVVLDRDQYDQIVHRAVAATPATDVADLRLVNKVLDKLEERGVRKPGDEYTGFMLPDGVEQEEFEFEDAEADFLAKRIEKFLPNLQGWAARRALPIFEALDYNGSKK